MGKKLTLPTLNEAVEYNWKTNQYQIKDLTVLANSQQLLLKPFIQQDTLNLPTINDLLLTVYPFVQKQSSEVVHRLIARQQRVNFLVNHAVKNKKEVKLVFEPLTEKDPFILNIAKAFIFDLNKFIYKYEIKNLWSNLILVNHDVNQIFLGQVDLLAQNEQDLFLLVYKTGQTSYHQKYSAELFLQKKLLESNTNLKVKKLFIFTPRLDRVVREADELTKQEIWKLENLMLKLKGGK